jgi:hypothetical protein
MTLRRARAAGTPLPIQAALLVLVMLTLAPSVLGRAGFQLLEDTVAQRIYPLHRHGVPGEAEYIAAHGAPAPFVHPHCHPPATSREGHTPAEFAVAGIVVGPMLCTDNAALPPAPPPSLAHIETAPLRPDGLTHAPAPPPPQA